MLDIVYLCVAFFSWRLPWHGLDSKKSRLVSIPRFLDIDDRVLYEAFSSRETYESLSMASSPLIS